MGGKTLSESDICDRHITPAIVAAGWDQTTQIYREYTFTDGPVQVRGKMAKRGARKRADYLLVHGANIPLAVVEAKDASHGVGAGLQQALGYAEALDVPFAISSNGSGFLIHDRTGRTTPVERQVPMDRYQFVCRRDTNPLGAALGPYPIDREGGGHFSASFEFAVVEACRVSASLHNSTDTDL